MKKSENEMWQILMNSCRKACLALGVDFKEPEYLDWTEGRAYFSHLWRQVKNAARKELQNRSKKP